MNKSDNTSWFSRNSKKTLLGFIIFTYLVLDLVAGSFFIFDTTRIYHPFFHHGFASNKESLSKWGNTKYVIYTDSLGFKDGEKRDIPLTNRKYRIVVIGDSFTEGVGYPHEKTFVGLTERASSATDKEVFNAGVMSYSPKLYYLKIKFLLEEVKFRFNELYVFIDMSDIRDDIQYRNFNPYKQSIFQKTIRYIDNFSRNHLFIYRTARDYILFGNSNNTFIPSRSKTSDFIKTILFMNPKNEDPGNEKQRDAANLSNNGGSDMSGLKESNVRGIEKYSDDAMFQKWGDPGLRLQEENIDLLCALCNKYGVKMTIAVYPWKNHIMGRQLTSRYLTFWEHYTARHNIGLLNYFPDFINETESLSVVNEYFIPGDIHWNDKGHEVIATKLIKRITATPY